MTTTQDTTPYTFKQQPDEQRDVVFYLAEEGNTISIGTTITTGIPIRPSQGNREVQDRLRAKWPSMLERARHFRQTSPDPTQSMISLFSNIGGDYDEWRNVLDSSDEL